jgi:hypothetical protein
VPTPTPPEAITAPGSPLESSLAAAWGQLERREALSIAAEAGLAREPFHCAHHCVDRAGALRPADPRPVAQALPGRAFREILPAGLGPVAGNAGAHA